MECVACGRLSVADSDGVEPARRLEWPVVEQHGGSAAPGPEEDARAGLGPTGVGGAPNDVTRVEVDEFWRAIKLDLFGTWLVCHYGIPEIIRAGGGAVVNATSVVALMGWPGKDADIRRLNALIHDFGVPVLPFHATLEDPDRPGRMKDEWTNEDGDHPSLAGYRRLGELAFRLP